MYDAVGSELASRVFNYVNEKENLSKHKKIAAQMALLLGALINDESIEIDLREWQTLLLLLRTRYCIRSELWKHMKHPHFTNEVLLSIIHGDVDLYRKEFEGNISNRLFNKFRNKWRYPVANRYYV